MRPRISIRGPVRPFVLPSVRINKNFLYLVLGFVGAKTISFSSQASSSSESPSPPYGLIRSLHICSKRYAGSLLGLNDTRQTNNTLAPRELSPAFLMMAIRKFTFFRRRRHRRHLHLIRRLNFECPD